MLDATLFIHSFFFFFNDTATTEIYTLSLHDALPIVPHQLPDPPLVERGLVPLVGVALGEETREGGGALDVEIAERQRQQPIEVQPVQAPGGLLHELEELGRVDGGDEIAGVPHEPDVEAPGMAREAVVGRMAVQGLPGAVGRVIVTEPLGRPRARDHESPRHTAHEALDLERHSVAEPLGVIGPLALRDLEPPEAQDLDGAAEDARQVARERLAPDHRSLPVLVVPASVHLPRTVSTGQGAMETTRPATLPRKNFASPVRPWVPITIRSARLDRAARAICSCGTPSSSTLLTLTPPFFALAMSRST